MTMILAIGNSGSYEVAAFKLVLEELGRRGENAILFKQDKCLEDDYLTFEVIDGKPRYFVVIDNVKYDTDIFSTVWYMHPHLPRELLQYEPAEHRQFIHRQFDEMGRALWTLLSHKKWINDSWTAFAAENKIYQLCVAVECGFTVPNTLITSSPDQVRDFFETHSRDIIVKLFAASPILDHVVYTNRVKPEQMDNIDSVRFSPSIFQANIPKGYELRITVVGDRIFPVKILSQQDEETAVDWRRKPKLNDFDVKMEPTVLPEEVVSKIFSFMKKMELKYGCIDMIVTPSGEYIFLEVNPNGQWYFVQLRTNMEIAKAIADLLI